MAVTVKKSTKTLKVALGIIILMLIAFRVGRHFGNRPTLSADYGPVADFAFVDQSGKAFGSNDLKGKVWIADFFFTRCMGPCPMLTTRMAELQKEDKKKKITFVSFSVDPTFDTPAELTKYASIYGADLSNWHFVTGSKEKIYELIRNSFHLAVEQKPPEKPSLNDILHSTYFVLVNKQGHVVGYFNSTDQESLNKLRDALAHT